MKLRLREGTSEVSDQLISAVLDAHRKRMDVLSQRITNLLNGWARHQTTLAYHTKKINDEQIGRLLLEDEVIRLTRRVNDLTAVVTELAGRSV